MAHWAVRISAKGKNISEAMPTEDVPRIVWVAGELCRVPSRHARLRWISEGGYCGLMEDLARLFSSKPKMHAVCRRIALYCCVAVDASSTTTVSSFRSPRLHYRDLVYLKCVDP